MAAQERLRSTEEAKQAAEARLARLRAEAAALVVREAVLDRASAIEHAFHALDAYRAARDSLPRMERERAQLSQRIGKLLAELGSPCDIERASGLLPPETLAARVDSLIDEHGRLAERDQQLDEQIRARQAAIGRLEDRLASLPESASVDELEATLASVAGAADLDGRRRKLDRDIADQDGRLRREAAALWAGSLAELVALTVPLAGTAGTFDDEFASLAQEERVVAEKETTLTGDLRDRNRELKVLAATGEVVTHSEVAAARAERDGRWADLRRACIDEAPGPLASSAGAAQPRALASAVEAAIREADRLADLLRADTERAAKLETTRQRIAEMQAEMRRNERGRLALAGKRRELRLRWETLIAPLGRSGLSPAELREWLSRRERLVERYGDLERLRADRDSIDGEIVRARERLDRALLACGMPAWSAGESAADALARAQVAVNAARKARADRDSVSEQIRAGTAELRDLHKQRQRTAEKLAESKLKWAEAAEGLRLRADALPAEARTRLDQFSRLSAALGELQALDATRAEHGRTITVFETRVGEIAGAVGEDMQGRSADAVAERLYEALADARSADTKRQQLAGGIEREMRTISQEGLAAAQARGALDRLLRQAGCERPEQLPELEAKAARSHAVRERLGEIEARLVQQNARAVEEVVEEAGGLTTEDIAGRIADTEAEIEDLERRVEAAQRALFGAKQRLDAIDGGAAAADAQQAARSLAARIAKEAGTYARVRLASAVLDRVVQLYR
ncbi:MAG: hypothetical protein Fur0039_02750 [Rhodocyclaceae bacterium]